MSGTIKKLVKFGVVGTSGFVIDFAVTWFFYEFFGLSIFVATGIGFTFGAISNYFFNRRWTWRSTNPNIGREFVKFYSVSLAGLGIHYLVLTCCTLLPWLTFSGFGVDINNDWSSKLVATGVVMVWNFLVNNFYTFKRGGKVEVIFATNNGHKVAEVVGELRGVRVLTLAECGVDGEIPETSPTLEGNAAQKARWVYERTDGKRDVFADDTGLEVEALGGEPGVYSARYSGGGMDANIDLVLSKLDGVENRSAQFRTVICLKRGGSGEELFFEGVVKGRILTERHGDDGFGYDSVFEPEGYNISFAQMSLEAKNAISHRGRAVRALSTQIIHSC